MPLRAILSALTLVLTMTSQCAAAPALWRITDADSSVWLFGSMQALDIRTDWRTTTLDKAVAKARHVYFELDPGVEAQAKLTALTAEFGYNRGGELLSATIGADLTERVSAVADASGVPMSYLLAMRPWLAASVLSSQSSVSGRYNPALGVEVILSEEVPLERHRFMETPKEYIGLASGGTLEEQIGILTATLDALGTETPAEDRIVSAWATGQLDEMAEIFQTRLDYFAPETVERLIVDRHQRWAEEIEGVLAQRDDALMVLSASHLVGPFNLLSTLEARGLIIERVQ